MWVALVKVTQLTLQVLLGVIIATTFGNSKLSGFLQKIYLSTQNFFLFRQFHAKINERYLKLLVFKRLKHLKSYQYSSQLDTHQDRFDKEVVIVQSTPIIKRKILNSYILFFVYKCHTKSYYYKSKINNVKRNIVKFIQTKDYNTSIEASLTDISGTSFIHFCN